MMALQNGSRKNEAKHVDPGLRALGKAAVGFYIKVLRVYMLAVEQGVGRGQQKGGSKQVPLNFQKGIGADIEGFAHRPALMALMTTKAQNQPNQPRVCQ